MTNHDEVTVVEQASPAHCVAIARKELDDALAELQSESPDLGHVYHAVHTARIWLPGHLEKEWDETMAGWLHRYNEHLRERTT